MQDQATSAAAATPGSPNGSLVFGRYQFDSRNGVLTSNGAEIPLPPRALRVLEHLLDRPGEVVSKQELLETVWGNTVVAESSLSEAVTVLRHALEDDPLDPTYVQTIHRRGYRFIAPLSAGTAIQPVETGPGRFFAERRHRLAGLALVAAGFIALVGALMTVPSDVASDTAEAAFAFEERDWVLIAAFENRTGEALLDGTLEHALSNELSNSRFVNVVPHERIGDTLRLMRKPADTTVDAALGQEISLRDGGVRALLTGRVERLGSSYLLSVALADPTRGQTVMTFTEEAEGQEQVLPAVRRLSGRVREALGEALPSIQESETSLAKATTPSLLALQLYTRADELITSNNQEAAAVLLHRAVAEDPEFASAYILLAFAISNTDAPRADFLPYAERAVQLSDKTTERERYFIRGSYFAMTDQPQAAVANYQALLQIDPDHYWGISNLARHYLFDGPRSMEDAIRYRVRLAQLRPNSFQQAAAAASILAIYANRPSEAEPYARRAAELAEIDPSLGPRTLAWVRLYPAHRRWLEGDLEGVVEELERWRPTLRSSNGVLRDELARRTGAFYLALGMLEAAEEAFLLHSDPGLRDRYLSEVEFARMDEEEGAAYLYEVEHSMVEAERTAAHPGPNVPEVLRSVSRMASAGRLSEARRALAGVIAVPAANSFYGRMLVPLARAEIALAEGNSEEAIQLFQEGLASVRITGGYAYFRDAESLASSWEQLGNLDMARRTLREASQQKSRTYPYFSSPFNRPSAKQAWMRVQLRLAQLNRKLDRETEALEIEVELRQLLRYADPDLWIVRQLAGDDGALPS